MTLSSKLIVAFSVVAMATFPASAQITYTFEDFSVSGSAFSFATGINASNEVVGQFFDSSFAPRAFYRDAHGSITLLNDGGAAKSSAEGINDAGTVVGWIEDANGLSSGVSGQVPWTTTTRIDLPGAVSTPTQIPTTGTLVLETDESGTLVGAVDLATGRHGFIRRPDGSVELFERAGADGTLAVDINNNGVVVGNYIENGLFRAFKYESGVLTDIVPPNSSAAIASGINDSGQIVGFFDDASSGQRLGYLFDGTDFHTIDRGTFGTVAYKINNAGNIVGWTIGDGFGSFTAFQGTLIPEPGTLSLLAGGALLAVGRRRQGR